MLLFICESMLLSTLIREGYLLRKMRMSFNGFLFLLVMFCFIAFIWFIESSLCGGSYLCHIIVKHHPQCLIAGVLSWVVVMRSPRRAFVHIYRFLGSLNDTLQCTILFLSNPCNICQYYQ